MERKYEEINDALVKVYNDMLIFEESELKKGEFNDLSIKEMHTIEAIGMYNPKTTSEVAYALSITVGTLTVAVNNLVKKEYVKRIRSDEDRRVVKLGLTKKGRLVFRVHQSFHQRMVIAALGGIPEDERQALIRGLNNLHNFLTEQTNV